MTLPSGLQSLSFGHCFNQSLEHVTLASSLQSLSFGNWFNQCLQRTTRRGSRIRHPIGTELLGLDFTLMYIFCIHVLYIYLYFYISIYIYIILYLHLYHSISTSIYLQGHLGGHWLPSISINHPFQFLGTITFKSLNLPCSIKYFSEPSLSAWVRAAQSREEQQWQLGPQGPQDRGGDWGGGLRDGSSSGAAGREMGSASDLVVFFDCGF